LSANRTNGKPVKSVNNSYQLTGQLFWISTYLDQKILKNNYV